MTEPNQNTAINYELLGVFDALRADGVALPEALQQQAADTYRALWVRRASEFGNPSDDLVQDALAGANWALGLDKKPSTDAARDPAEGKSRRELSREDKLRLIARYGSDGYMARTAP